MSSLNLSKTLRTLGLAAALVSPLAAGHAFADGEYISGPTAYPAWSQTQLESRTPLASNSANQSQGDAAVQSLEQSGATGGGGQHA
jgi:hypothetical protein